VDEGYACIISITFMMMSGDGPNARDLVSQSGSLRTLVMVGDRGVADMAAARAAAVDAAPAGSVASALRDDLAPASSGNRGRAPRSGKAAPLDLDAFERQCLEDDGLDPEVAARRLAKVALARQYRDGPTQQRDGSAQQLALVKRQKIADVEKYEEESKAAKEAAVEKMRAERDQTQVERARIQAERQQVEDDAKAAREERDRQRAHAAELAEEKRRAEIRKAAAEGAIAQAAAEEMLAENRRTPILRLERWIGTALRCPNPSGCSSVLKQRFNASVTNGEHAKPAGHRDFSGSWVLFEEHDGAHLRALHQAVHDARNGVQPGQKRLFA